MPEKDPLGPTARVRGHRRTKYPWWRGPASLVASCSLACGIIVVANTDTGSLRSDTGDPSRADWPELASSALFALPMVALVVANVWVLLRRAPGTGPRALVRTCAGVSGVVLILSLAGLVSDLVPELPFPHSLPFILSLGTLVIWRRTDWPRDEWPGRRGLGGTADLPG